ncbi:MAG: hypothetical protein DRP35_00645 [Candidatus Zixiibacteriota bacterium]|nr:MAG: hypothetical protein DRP35_00645 [candidate division Zixibacteria bacterium]
METYLLSSKLNEIEREFVIKTTNDAKLNAVKSIVYVNGQMTDETKAPHPIEYTPEEILALVKNKHEEKKQELEIMLQSFKYVAESGIIEDIYNLGTAFFYKQYYREARELFHMSLSLKNDHHQSYNYLGMTEIELGNYVEALEFCENAVELRPKFADYRYNLGHAYLNTNSYKKAVSEFQEALKINLYYADAYLSLSLAYLKNAIERNETELFKDVLSNTIDYINKAAIIDPFYSNEIHAEGLGALRNMDIEVAYTLFQRLLNLKKVKRNDELSSYYMKYVYSHNGANEYALNKRINYLNGEIENNPSYADLYVEQGANYLRLSKISWKRSMEHLKRALDVNPNMENVIKLLNEIENEYENIHKISADTDTGNK